MNIIITNFTQGSQTPTERAANNVENSLREGDKSFDRAQNTIKEGTNKIEKSLNIQRSLPSPRKINSQPPSKYNPAPSNSSGMGSPQNNQQNTAHQPAPIVIDSHKDENSVVSNTGWQARKDNPVAVRNIDLGSSIGGATDSIFVGKLKSSDKIGAVVQSNTPVQEISYLKPRQRYNTYIDVTSSNAKTPNQLAGLSGVWRG